MKLPEGPEPGLLVQKCPSFKKKKKRKKKRCVCLDLKIPPTKTKCYLLALHNFITRMVEECQEVLLRKSGSQAKALREQATGVLLKSFHTWWN